MIFLWLSLFVVLVIFFWIINFIGLPGNWMILGSSLIWMLTGPEAYRFGWLTLVVLAFLAIIGELVEFGASVLGTKKFGGSTRGATLSVIGSIVGGIIGAIFGIPFPVPLVGVLIGAILFAALGAWIGASLGERWAGKPVKECIQVGGAAFAGRLVGTAGKLALGAIMMVVAIISPFLPW